MASELVPDILSGLVALGTGALAVSTYGLSRGTSRAAIDSASPRVVVDQFDADDEAYNFPMVAKAEPMAMQPHSGKWHRTQHSDTLVGMRASGVLRNESPMTALIRFECGERIEMGNVVLPGPPPNPNMPPARTPLNWQGSWRVLPPGRTASFEIYWWRPMGDWVQGWERHVQKPAAPPPVATVRLHVRGVTGESAEDTCDLSFGGYIFVSHPREDGWVVGPVDPDDIGIPGMAPPRVVTVSLVHRFYPRAGWRARLAGVVRRPLMGPPRRRALPGSQPPPPGSGPGADA